MSCCGQSAGRLVIDQKDIDNGLALEIEYAGGRTVTVTGLVTGKTYVFSGLHRLAAVHPRDAITLLREARFRLKRVIEPKQESKTDVGA
jgi:hypothetical protein